MKSLISNRSTLNQAIRVGDFVKAGEAVGTVEQIGLRSTNVRVLDKALVTIPNGQVATMVLENYAALDCFSLRHVVGIRYLEFLNSKRAVMRGAD